MSESRPFELSVGEDGVRFSVRSDKVYSKEVILSTAYLFTDRYYVFLDREEALFTVRLKGKSRLAADAVEALAGEFHNEMLNQQIRLGLSQKRGRIREMIMAKALYSAGSARSEVPAGDQPPDQPPPEQALTPEEESILKMIDEGVFDEYLEKGGDDFLDDPLGIAVPWEQKYATDKPGGESPQPEPVSAESAPAEPPAETVPEPSPSTGKRRSGGAGKRPSAGRKKKG